MPKGKRVSQEALMKEARKRVGELAKAGMEDINWEEVHIYEDETRDAYAQKRLLGISETMLQAEHDINQMPFRLANVEESPRKKAAETVWEIYRDCYEQATDLRFERKVWNEASSLLNQGVYTLSKEEKVNFNDQNEANAGSCYTWMERMSACRNFANSFLEEHAVPVHENWRDAEAPDVWDRPYEFFAERWALGEIWNRLDPQSAHRDFRTREFYETQKPLTIKPKEAVMNMNPTALTSITVDEFPASVRGENPSRVNLEWGAATFDDMLERLYNKDQWKELKQNQKDLLSTVYLNGKSASEVFPRKEGEAKADYEQRAKSQVVAYALEGKGKLDITPYQKGGEGYALGNPVPVRVNVNLPEKVSAWKRFLRFFNVKLELKKEKAQRISRDDLDRGEYLNEVRENVQRLNQREEDSRFVRGKIEAAQERAGQANLDFFGYLLPRKPEMTGEEMAQYKLDLDQKVSQLALAPISPELQKELGQPQANVSKTMGRESSRTSLVRLFAMSRGMSMEQVLSADPALREQKEKIGREFMEIISVKRPEDFYREKGQDADYKAYFQEKCQKAYNTFKTINQTLADVPYDYFHGTSVRELAEHYEELELVTSAGCDVYQSNPDHVKNLNFDEMDGLERKSKAIEILSGVCKYMKDYVATDQYVHTEPSSFDERTKLAEGLYHKLLGERAMKDTQGIQKLGDLKSVLTDEWESEMLGLRLRATEQAFDDTAWCMDLVNYMEKDGKPVCRFDEQTRSWEVGKAETIQRKLQEQAAQAERQAAPGRQSVGLDALEEPSARNRTSLRDRERQPLSKEPLQKKGPEKAGIRK